MSSSKGFGLILKKQTPSSDASKPRVPAQVASIFNEDSDDEDIKKASASDRFDHKYGNLKAKDQREQEKVLAEDPTAYEYDSVYEEAQRKKNEKTEQQLQADAEKKPKYADKLVTAHKKRELEKLLHDENTYKKEREKEAGEFEDKEIYVTGAYKKQIEERNKFREEIEQSDAMDALTKVADQSLWQQAFNGSCWMTEPELAVKTEPAEEPTSTQLKTPSQPDVKTKLSQAAAEPKEVKPSIYSSDEEEIPPKEKTPPKSLMS
uniref:Nuclear speckle splicing regulatory protein 1 N-terminal domain-containing protein n=1 Tax=Ditylenchus dipsaci TaxID=166011 RepID=A0A915E5Z5_9BILA